MSTTGRYTLILLLTCLLNIVIAKYCDDKNGTPRKCDEGSCCSSDDTGCCKIGASLWYTWLLIIFFAILVCVCVACCRRCYCNQSNYSSNRQVAITVETNVQPMEHSHQSLSSSGSGYNKSNIDAPPSYFDVTPNYIQQNDLPPPYPGENNT